MTTGTVGDSYHIHLQVKCLKKSMKLIFLSVASLIAVLKVSKESTNDLAVTKEQKRNRKDSISRAMGLLLGFLDNLLPSLANHNEGECRKSFASFNLALTCDS